MSCEPRVKFPELRLASPWLDQGRGWRGRDDLSAMVAVQSCIHHCKKFVTPIRRVLPHPFIGNELHILRSEEHTSELQSLMRISYAVFCLKKKKQKTTKHNIEQTQITK